MRHTGCGSSHISIPAYAETLTILTGKDITDPYQYGRRPQNARAASGREARQPSGGSRSRTRSAPTWTTGRRAGGGAGVAPCEAGRVVMSGSSTDPDEWKERPTCVRHLSPALLRRDARGLVGPARLAAGRSCTPRCCRRCWPPPAIGPDPKEPLARDTSRPAYAVVAMLAALRKNGELDELDDIAEDTKQSAGTRLTCVMALFRAGEKLRTHVLLSTRRQRPATWSGGWWRSWPCATPATIGAAGELLVKLIDDAERRDSHGGDLAPERPAAATGRAQAQAGDRQPRPAAGDAVHLRRARRVQVRASLRSAGRIPRRRPGGQTQSRHLSYALSALQTATGQRWTGEDRERATAAVAWWREEGRRTIEP